MEINEYLHETVPMSPGLSCEDEIEGATILPPTLLLIGSLIVLYTITGPWDPHAVWFERGAGDGKLILENRQWYRLATMLTLHADTTHLLNNCLLGGPLLHLYLLRVGSGIGLFALVLASVAGNGINIAIHGNEYISVGFSTAVFAVIGMLAILRYREKRDSISHDSFLPLMGAFALLAFLGSSGAHSDLGAHFFGLLSGLLLGNILVLPAIQTLRRSFVAQFVFFVLSLSIVILSWVLAFAQ